MSGIGNAGALVVPHYGGMAVGAVVASSEVVKGTGAASSVCHHPLIDLARETTVSTGSATGCHRPVKGVGIINAARGPAAYDRTILSSISSTSGSGPMTP